MLIDAQDLKPAVATALSRALADCKCASAGAPPTSPTPGGNPSAAGASPSPSPSPAGTSTNANANASAATVINIIPGVPPGTFQVPGLSPSPAPPSGKCRYKPYTNYQARVLVLDVNSWTSDKRVTSPEDCCTSCLQTPGCNVFVYCPTNGGCGQGR